MSKAIISAQCVEDHLGIHRWRGRVVALDAMRCADGRMHGMTTDIGNRARKAETETGRRTAPQEEKETVRTGRGNVRINTTCGYLLAAVREVPPFTSDIRHRKKRRQKRRRKNERGKRSTRTRVEMGESPRSRDKEQP